MPFRETAVKAHDMPPPKAGPGAPRGTVHGAAAHTPVTFTIRVVPLPPEITSFLLENISVVRGFRSGNKDTDPDNPNVLELESEAEAAGEEVVRASTTRPEDFAATLQKMCQQAGGEWAALGDPWSFGPQNVGPNLLFDRRADITRRMYALLPARPEILVLMSLVTASRTSTTQNSKERTGLWVN